ncbi:hypothetical protein [Streptomyces sp. SID161]|uniref:hypothetical protein n=1 Tax=Streptomyces sp. SID161 TaxID=2690251 RepID=UPI0013702076|nr:hypothetical protein [Streptomyces sp. SID161]MYW46366.1 hypothetical protein [Streptomyces sp. SID161]
MTDTPPPLAVDYSGRPLHAGDTVAYITRDPIALRQGRIRVIGPNNICVEDGVHLILFDAAFAGWATTRPKPLGGETTISEDAKQVHAYPHVALQAPEGGA